MKRFRDFLHDERAQTLPFIALAMMAVLGMAAVVMDVGDVYYSYHELQAATDAAALAGAQSLPGAAATSAATTYSAVSGNKNARGNLRNVTMVSGYPLLECLATLTNQGVACVAPTNANAIQVKQQVDVPLYFGALFGIRRIHLTATATASMRGSIATPYNVAIILDTTPSMDTRDSNCGNKSRLNCALAGVQVLLQALSPCAASLSTCTITNGVAANSVDRVSLFTFPNPTVGTASKEFDCTTSDPSVALYSFPSSSAGSYQPTGSNTATYQITGFLSDYKTSNSANSLNSNSNLTAAVGAKRNCSGLTTLNSYTYYAGAIYAAQASLAAAQAANPSSQNVIILLTDGDANAPQWTMDSSAKNTGRYPSYVNQCGQAVMAAQAAAAAGTRFYTVAYGALSSGCSTDTTNASGSFGITPCQAMAQMASSPGNFYSDYNQSGSGSNCFSDAQPTTDLNQIFSNIAGDLTLSRLIPDGTT
jgi:hypothetical protein